MCMEIPQFCQFQSSLTKAPTLGRTLAGSGRNPTIAALPLSLTTPVNRAIQSPFLNASLFVPKPLVLYFPAQSNCLDPFFPIPYIHHPALPRHCRQRTSLFLQEQSRHSPSTAGSVVFFSSRTNSALPRHCRQCTSPFLQEPLHRSSDPASSVSSFLREPAVRLPTR